MASKDSDDNKYAVAIRSSASILQRLRLLAYASEFGESGRFLFSPALIKSLYGLSIAYVSFDTIVHTMHVQQKTKNNKIAAINFMDRAAWHTGASMVFPAVTIHGIVKLTNKVITKNFSNMKWLRFMPACAGLISIPFIIHPLDHLMDFLMDNSMRKLYRDKLELGY